MSDHHQTAEGLQRAQEQMRNPSWSARMAAAPGRESIFSPTRFQAAAAPRDGSAYPMPASGLPRAFNPPMPLDIMGRPPTAPLRARATPSSPLNPHFAKDSAIGPERPISPPRCVPEEPTQQVQITIPQVENGHTMEINLPGHGKIVLKFLGVKRDAADSVQALGSDASGDLDGEQRGKKRRMMEE